MDVIMPQLGETVKDGAISAWYKKVGEPVTEGETLFDVSTDKVDTEIPAPVSGILAEILVEAGSRVTVGTRLAVIRAGTASPRGNAGRRLERVDGKKVTPLARRLMSVNGVTPADVAALSQGARIGRREVEDFVARRAAPAAPAAAPQPLAVRATAADAGDAAIEPLNKLRRLAGETLTRSVQTIPHVLQVVEVDYHAVERIRRTRGPAWKAAEGFSLTYLPFVVRAVALALAAFPRVNAYFTEQGLALQRRINLGIAVDLGFEGLVVPVLHDADGKTVRGLARDIAALAAKARQGRLSAAEVSGATYTLSNNGAFGTVLTAPIINPPQVAILSTDAVRKKAVVLEGADGDAIAIRPIGLLAQSFDHRAFDGATSAAFLARVKRTLEEHDWEGEWE
jgi:2-oxoglutarate dehydrogenase E2 component (dihydrolipoamide succinyltransferase)